MDETPLLYMLAVDGGHMKSAFGGIILAAVVATANSRLFPIAWSVTKTEDEENCVWFAEQLVKRFGDVHFVWMTDQGSGFMSDAFEAVLVDAGQLHGLCSKHLIKTLEVAKSKKELSGSLSGVRELVHNFARSRSKEWCFLKLGQKMLMWLIILQSAETLLRQLHFSIMAGIEAVASRSNWLRASST